MINPCRFSKRQSWRYIILGSLSVLTIGLWISPTSASAQDKAAVLLPGSINDQSWNAQGFQGVGSLKALGWDVAYSENVQPADMAQALQDYARRGYTLLIGHTGRFQSPMQLLGPKFPKVTFIIGGGDKGFGKNVASVDYNNAQFVYLMGILAARMSKTGIIGSVNALEGLPIFWQSLWVTIKLNLVINPLQVILATLLAVMANHHLGSLVRSDQVIRLDRYILCPGHAGFGQRRCHLPLPTVLWADSTRAC